MKKKKWTKPELIEMVIDKSASCASGGADFFCLSGIDASAQCTTGSNNR